MFGPVFVRCGCPGVFLNFYSSKYIKMCQENMYYSAPENLGNLTMTVFRVNEKYYFTMYVPTWSDILLNILA